MVVYKCQQAGHGTRWKCDSSLFDSIGLLEIPLVSIMMNSYWLLSLLPVGRLMNFFGGPFNIDIIFCDAWAEPLDGDDSNER